jgi:predicted NBD/HSP70 family sugar kinase
VAGEAKRGRNNGSGPDQKTKAIECVRCGPADIAMPHKTLARLRTTLADTGWIRERGDGRWELGPASGNVLAIAAGREELSCALSRPDGILISRAEVRLFIDPPRNVSGARTVDFVSELAKLIGECVAAGDGAPIVAVAIAWPGRIVPTLNDGRGDPLDYRQESGGWEETPSLAGLVQDALDGADLSAGQAPIFVVNDADAVLMALTHTTTEDREEFPDLERIQEMADAAKTILGVTIAGGVGGALMVGRKRHGIRRTVERGAHGYAGELGQIPIDISDKHLEAVPGGRVPAGVKKLEESRPRWNYPVQGSLDFYASGRSILDQLSPRRTGGTGYNDLIGPVETRMQGDQKTQYVMRRSGRVIGQALIGPMLTLDPDLILVSSFAASTTLRDGLRDTLSSSTDYIGLDPDSILLAPKDPDRALKGAARWAIEQRLGPMFDDLCVNGNGKALTSVKLLAQSVLEHAIVPTPKASR